MIEADAGYVFMVKLDVADPADEPEFNTWYNTHHVRDLMASDGFLRGWRTRDVEHPANFGEVNQRYWAIYAIETKEPFERRASRTAGAPRTAGERAPMDLSGLRLGSNHGRVLYELIAAAESDDGFGTNWVRFEFDVDGPSDEIETALRDDVLTTMVDQPGVHRAWQLKASPNEIQSGPHPPGAFVTIFEVDAPDDILDDRALSPFAASFASSWPALEPRGRRVAEKLFDLTREQVAR